MAKYAEGWFGGHLQYVIPYTREFILSVLVLFFLLVCAW